MSDQTTDARLDLLEAMLRDLAAGIGCDMDTKPWGDQEPSEDGGGYWLVVLLWVFIGLLLCGLIGIAGAMISDLLRAP